MVSHVPLMRELGAGGIHLGLSDEFRRLGHSVETFDHLDAFPGEDPRRWHRLFPLRFARRAREFVRRHGSRFDVIDALEGVGPLPKRAMGFKGMVVARSCGLGAFYQHHLEYQRTRWPDRLPGTRVGQIVAQWSQRRIAAACEKSLRSADLVNLVNDDELTYVSKELGLGHKSVVFPLGMSDARARALATAAADPRKRREQKEIAFIGAWSLRKGAADWGAIIRRTRALVPGARFNFLGTGLDEGAVLRDLKVARCDWLSVVPQFSSDELPGLLSKATIGALPSYIEGMPLGVLEQLAAGIPTVAYDVPGPRVMLRQLGYGTLCPPGDVVGFSRLLAELVTLSMPVYTELSTQSRRIAGRYLWPEIATATLNAYAAVFMQLREAAHDSPWSAGSVERRLGHPQPS